MARNKYPEETVEKILDVSARLFVEKGYEHTSIQDIVDNLGGLTKGAIYHHFKSKEDIMIAALEHKFLNYDDEWIKLLRVDSSMTGKEKLRELFWASISNSGQEDVFTSAPNMLKSPKMLAEQLRSIKEETAPFFLRPIIEQGVADGSIKTDHPEQLAEVILILINIWVTPMLFPATTAELIARLEVFGQLLEPFDANFLDEEMWNRMMELAGMYEKNA